MTLNNQELHSITQANGVSYLDHFHSFKDLSEATGLIISNQRCNNNPQPNILSVCSYQQLGHSIFP